MQQYQTFVWERYRPFSDIPDDSSEDDENSVGLPERGNEPSEDQDAYTDVGAKVLAFPSFTCIQEWLMVTSEQEAQDNNDLFSSS